MGLFSTLKMDKQDSPGDSNSESQISSTPDGVVSRIKSEYFPKKQARFDILADSFETWVSQFYTRFAVSEGQEYNIM